jgi:hypothetical protein
MQRVEHGEGQRATWPGRGGPRHGWWSNGAPSAGTADADHYKLLGALSTLDQSAGVEHGRAGAHDRTEGHRGTGEYRVLRWAVETEQSGLALGPPADGRPCLNSGPG